MHNGSDANRRSVCFQLKRKHNTHTRFHNREKLTCASAQDDKQAGLRSDIDTLSLGKQGPSAKGMQVFFVVVFLSIMLKFMYSCELTPACHHFSLHLYFVFIVSLLKAMVLLCLEHHVFISFTSLEDSLPVS